MRNQLAVAVANLEAWLDGKLDPTPLRIKAVLEALSAIDALIDDLYATASPGEQRELHPPTNSRVSDARLEAAAADD